MDFLQPIGGPKTSRHWLKLEKDDDSGADAYVPIEQLKGVVVEDPATPTITLYFGVATAVKKGNSAEMKDMYMEVTGQPAADLLNWLEAEKSLVIRGAWTPRPDPV